MSKSQNETVLNWLKGKHDLTPLEAYQRWGIQRLGARVYDLKHEGHKIKSEMVDVYNRCGGKCRVARYTLTER